jgi:DNA-binding LacI/PurR family transcriptional regulator
MAAERLITQGRKKLVFFGDTHGPEIADRLTGVADAVAQADGGVTLTNYPTHLSSDEMGAQIAAHLDELGSAVDGIVAASDVIAMVTVRLLHERGLRIPQDVAITGFDDLPIAMQTVPRLTTVRQDIAGGAKAMVDSLMRRMAGEDVPSTVMMPELVGRESA